MVENHMPLDGFRVEVRRFLADAMTPDLRAASDRQVGLYSELLLWAFDCAGNTWSGIPAGPTEESPWTGS